MRSLADVARMAKLVDAGDSKSPAARRVGSSPTLGTTRHQAKQTTAWLKPCGFLLSISGRSRLPQPGREVGFSIGIRDAISSPCLPPEGCPRLLAHAPIHKCLWRLTLAVERTITVPGSFRGKCWVSFCSARPTALSVRPPPNPHALVEAHSRQRSQCLEVFVVNIGLHFIHPNNANNFYV